MREDIIRDILSTTITKEGLSGSQHLISLQVGRNTIQFILEGTPQQSKGLQDLKEQCEEKLKSQFPDFQIQGGITTQRPSSPHSSQSHKSSKLTLEGVKHIIAVASGKGGVGKSTVAVHLSVALAQLGLKVGLLDADIYGPSLPKMLNLQNKPDVSPDKKLIPLSQYNIKCLSMGLMIPADSPMIWRGPMVQGALQQMLRDVAWGELDFLVLDMPPGTGDAQLTMAQQVSLSGAVIVSTPQDVALADARKGINMFRKVAVPLLGIVENMSVYECTNCGHANHIFSHGGAQKTALEMDIPFLGEIPIHLSIRQAGDMGIPVNYAYPEEAISSIYRQMAQSVIDRVNLVYKAVPSIEIE